VTTDYEILVRNAAVVTAVNQRQRLIDLIVTPWDEEADVPWQGEMWRETFQRGAYDGIQDHAGRVPVNRQHEKFKVVGRTVSLDPFASEGLVARTKIAATPLGDETLELAADEMLHPSAGYYCKTPADIQINRQRKTRRVIRAFLDHIGMVDSQAYVGARVLAVREASSGLTVTETPLLATPALDAVQNDPLLEWARERLAAIK